VVAPFPVKKDGIIGLDLLRALGARIDIAAEEIDGQKIKLANHPSGGRKVNAQQSRVCRTEPRLSKSTEEGVGITTKKITELRRPVVEVVKEAPAKPSRRNPRLRASDPHDRRTGNET
jgi:hypothetical protein